MRIRLKMRNNKLESFYLKLGIGIMVYCICAICFLPLLKVQAEEFRMLYVSEDADIYEDADIASTSLLTLTKGDMVLVLEQQEDWCKVRYQTTTGYMQTRYLQETLEEDTQNGALQEEMQDIEEFHQEVAVEAEKVSRDKKTSLYWGIVIGGLIIAMFAAGIYRGIKGDKKE